MFLIRQKSMKVKSPKILKKSVVEDPDTIKEALGPDSADRKFRIRVFGFRKRIILYFLIFSAFFGLYVGAFLTGNSQLGDAIDNFANGIVTIFIVPVLTVLASIIPSTTISSLVMACIGFTEAEFVRVIAGDLVFSILLSSFIVLVMIVIRSQKYYESRQNKVKLEPVLEEKLAKKINEKRQPKD